MSVVVRNAPRTGTSAFTQLLRAGLFGDFSELRLIILPPVDEAKAYERNARRIYPRLEAAPKVRGR